MRRLTVLLVAWLGSSVIAGAAAAGHRDLSNSGLCRALENRLERCQGDTRLSAETRASCDRVEVGFQALCGPRETILASADADGAALDLLRQDYLVAPIEDAVSHVFPTHIVIGPSDLRDPDVIALLRKAYRVGKTVAIVNATEYQARSFHRLVRAGEEVNCAPLEGQREIELYGLQQSVTRTPVQNSSYCLLGPNDRRSAADLRGSDHGDRAAAADRRWLRERFGPTPPQPRAGAASPTDENPTEELTDLSTATHCSFKNTDTQYGSIEWDLYTYAMRDFTDTGCESCQSPGADYYLVQGYATFQPDCCYGLSPPVSYVVFVPGPDVTEASTGLALNTQLLGLPFADPQTVTTYESSYTNSSSVTVSESVGVNQNGPNVTAGESVTTSQSMMYDVPPTTILNQSDIADATPQWQFIPQSYTLGVDFDVDPTWLWYVPQDAYPSGGTGSGQVAFYAVPNFEQVDDNGNIADQSQWYPPPLCNVPYPFSAWTVAPPQLTSLDPTSTEIDGGQFTITGQFLYPGSVTAVLIGGQEIPLSTNVDLVNDTTIEVTVGGVSLPAGTYPVQVNTQFNGQDRFSNHNLLLTLTGGD